MKGISRSRYKPRLGDPVLQCFLPFDDVFFSLFYSQMSTNMLNNPAILKGSVSSLDDMSSVKESYVHSLQLINNISSLEKYTQLIISVKCVACVVHKISIPLQASSCPEDLFHNLTNSCYCTEQAVDPSPMCPDAFAKHIACIHSCWSCSLSAEKK